MEPTLSNVSRLAEGVGTVLGYARGVNFLGRRTAATRLVEHSKHSDEGHRDADDATSGCGIQGDCDDHKGVEVWKQDKQSTKTLITDLPTADDSSVHDKEWTWGRDGATRAAPGGNDGQKIQVSSGAYHLEITVDGSTTKIIFDSTAADLQVVVKRKEG